MLLWGGLNGYTKGGVSASPTPTKQKFKGASGQIVTIAKDISTKKLTLQLDNIDSDCMNELEVLIKDFFGEES